MNAYLVYYLLFTRPYLYVADKKHLGRPLDKRRIRPNFARLSTLDDPAFSTGKKVPGEPVLLYNSDGREDHEKNGP